MVLSVDRHTRIYYGDLKARLFRAYSPASPRQNHPERCIDWATGAELGIDENDLWIAAQAIQFNLILVTNDEMARIRDVAPELDIQDWTQPL
jgi:tRNA(fMet)-specific endonuclease VapC